MRNAAFCFSLLLAACAFAPSFPGVALADSVLEATDDLTQLPLEDLMNLTVTSVSKKEQRLASAATAIYIVTGEEIRRSGVTSIPEALRLAPGVQVARIDANKWAVSIRGFNGRFANKLLVLMDGRSIYTPLFSGVFWEAQDTVLEDVDRIEVIRGPGAALWGANAVNGVINIITRSANDTPGALVSVGGGSNEHGFATARYGASLTDQSHLRLYAKHQEHGNFVDAAGNGAHDAWESTLGGFRLDSQPTESDSLTLQGSYYSGRLDETYTLYRLPTPQDGSFSREENATSGMSGGNLLSRWCRNLSDTDRLSLQFYYDHAERSMVVLDDGRDILDLDFQHRLSVGGRNDVVWGLGYRFSHDRIGDTPFISFGDPHKNTNLFSAFLHDEITLLPRLLALILGSRFEHNDATGLEIQPNARIIWTPTSRASLWGSVSRALSTPSRGDLDIRYRYRTLSAASALNPGPLPVRLEIDGSGSFQSERLMAYEIGYRMEPWSTWSFDLAAFYNDYRRLRVVREDAPFTEPPGAPPANAVQPYTLTNEMHGHVYGMELSASWTPLPWWHLKGSYGYLQSAMYLDGASTDTVNRDDATGSSPRHQFSARSGFDLGRRVTLDLWLRGTDRLPSIDGESIPGFLTMDARLAWKPCQSLELSLVGQNLLQSQHREFNPEFINTHPSEVVRSAYAKASWQF